MTDDRTPRLGLPLLFAGQAQKEWTLNEALVLLDIVSGGTVQAIGIATPPVDPAAGDAWVVGAAPSGAWAGRAHAVAGWTEGGWRFVTPRAGLSLWSVADGVTARFDGTEWRSGDLVGRALMIDGRQVVGARRPAIDPPSGGETVDAAARAAIMAVLATLRQHGLTA